MFKRRLGTLAIAAALFLGIAAPASADHRNGHNQDGLVNVVVEDVTIIGGDVVDVTFTDVNIGVAAILAANLCDVQVGPIAVLATLVDRTGSTQTTECDATGGDIILTQN